MRFILNRSSSLPSCLLHVQKVCQSELDWCGGTVSSVYLMDWLECLDSLNCMSKALRVTQLTVRSQSSSRRTVKQLSFGSSEKTQSRRLTQWPRLLLQSGSYLQQLMLELCQWITLTRPYLPLCKSISLSPRLTNDIRGRRRVSKNCKRWKMVKGANHISQ